MTAIAVLQLNLIFEYVLHNTIAPLKKNHLYSV